MKEKSSQPQQPESSPGTTSGLDQALETPQAAPAVGGGPDSHNLPRSVKPQADDTDWKARYQGLDAKYQKDRQEWESQLSDIRNQIQSLVNPKAKSEPMVPADKPKPQAKESAKPDTLALDALDLAIQQRKAASYRDMVVESVARDLGMPALEMFSDDIPIRPPTRRDDGTIDDSAQIEAVKSFAQKLVGVQGEASKRTEDAFRQGMTPGSSPGAEPRDESVYDEFLELMEVFGSAEFDDLPAADQRRIESRYFELTNNDQVIDTHQGQVSPTSSWRDIQDEMRSIVKRVSMLEGRGRSPYGNMA